jgi:hypothetical protein
MQPHYPVNILELTHPDRANFSFDGKSQLHDYPARKYARLAAATPLLHLRL